MRPFELLKPHLDYLPQYAEALKKGWSPDNMREAEAAIEELAEIEKDSAKFIVGLTDHGMGRATVTLQDGSVVPRLPGFRRWMWDGDFCGSVGFRWQPGTSALPPYVLGHIGYATVPWKRGRGYATRALEILLTEVKEIGLAYVDVTSDPDNLPSQKVILANGGTLVERFRKPESQGATDSFRFRIHLMPG